MGNWDSFRSHIQIRRPASPVILETAPEKSRFVSPANRMDSIPMLLGYTMVFFFSNWVRIQG